MMRYFYDCPIKAAYMAKYFGMSASWSDAEGRQLSHLVRDSILNRYDGTKIYIHPNSLHLLQPKDRDLVLRPDRLDSDAWHTDAENKIDLVIVQRNGKAFIWPEMEE